jgi:ribosomal protein L37E
MTFDPATKSISGRYCERCGRQEFRRQTTNCQICGGDLFKWRPSRRNNVRHDRTNPSGPTWRQKKVLERFGYDTKMKKHEATKIIGAIANNGWRPLESAIDKEFQTIVRHPNSANG